MQNPTRTSLRRRESRPGKGGQACHAANLLETDRSWGASNLHLRLNPKLKGIPHSAGSFAAEWPQTGGVTQ